MDDIQKQIAQATGRLAHSDWSMTLGYWETDLQRYESWLEREDTGSVPGVKEVHEGLQKAVEYARGRLEALAEFAPPKKGKRKA